MSAGPQVVLDACVLATFSLCDTLLRLAETPSLYAPKWSAEIMAETVRTLDARLGWPAQLTSYFQSELLSHFGDAWVTGYEPLITRMTTTRRIDTLSRRPSPAEPRSSSPLISVTSAKSISIHGK